MHLVSLFRHRDTVRRVGICLTVFVHIQLAKHLKVFRPYYTDRRKTTAFLLPANSDKGCPVQFRRVRPSPLTIGNSLAEVK